MPYETKKTSSNYLNKIFLNQDCLIVTAFEAVQGRWTTQVLVCVKMGFKRFGLLKEKLPGITDNVLALRLNHLVKNRLITKTMVGAERTYELTEAGDELIKVLEDFGRWQEKRSGVVPGRSCFKNARS